MLLFVALASSLWTHKRLLALMLSETGKQVESWEFLVLRKDAANNLSSKGVGLIDNQLLVILRHVHCGQTSLLEFAVMPAACVWVLFKKKIRLSFIISVSNFERFLAENFMH